MIGFVKLHRLFTEWEWYHDERVKSVFLHLLLKCNWEERQWRGITIPPGTYITSTHILADQLGLSRSAVNRTLGKLRSTGEVVTKADSKWTAVTLVNWAKYQGEGSEAGQQTDINRTANEPQTGQQTDTTKKDKNIRREEEKKERDARAPVRMTFEEFREACLAVHATLKAMPDPEARKFFDYWTEGHATGKGRWQLEKVFDIAKRMRTWAERAANNGKPAPPPPKPGELDQSKIKPWLLP